MLPQLDILCTSAVKRNYAKTLQFTVYILPVFQHSFTCFPAHQSWWKQKTGCRVVSTLICLISYSGELYNKNCIVRTSETLIIWSTSCYTLLGLC